MYFLESEIGFFEGHGEGRGSRRKWERSREVERSPHYARDETIMLQRWFVL